MVLFLSHILVTVTWGCVTAMFATLICHGLPSKAVEQKRRSALFWATTQRVAVIPYRRFGTISVIIFKGQGSVLDS
jgi:hypothetical protein